MVLQYSAVLEEHTLQWVVTGHRWFGKELGCHVSTPSLAETVDQQIEVTGHTCTTSGSNKTLLSILFKYQEPYLSSYYLNSTCADY